MSRRMERVNVLLRQEISNTVSADLKDPRLSPVITVTRVDASPDLSYAKVYVSVMGEQAQKDDALKALKSASGFVRKNLRRRLTLRSIPAVGFHLDESIEQGAKVLKLIDQLAPGPEIGEAS